MAKILLTAFVDAISGSIKGTTFSRNRSGAYVAGKKVTKFKAGSELGDSVNTPQGGSTVMSIRARFAVIAKTWRTLTNIQRDSFNQSTADWKSKDSLGNDVTPSGYNVFTSLNNTSQSLQAIANPVITPILPLITSVPVKAKLPSVGSVTLDITAVGLDGGFPVPSQMWLLLVGFNIADLNRNNAILIEMTRPMSPGISKVSESDFRQIEVVHSLVTSNIEIKPAYVSIFGEPVLNQKIFVRVSFVDIESGQKGVPNLYSEIVAPYDPDKSLTLTGKKAKEVK